MTTSTYAHHKFGDVIYGDHFYLNNPKLKVEVLSFLRDVCLNSSLPMSPESRRLTTKLFEEDFRDVHQVPLFLL